MGSEFISVEREEAERLATARSGRLRKFVNQWATDDIPACSTGMELLMAFAEAHPGAYRLTFTRGLDGDPHPIVRNIPKWKVYAEHRSTCHDCNER